jgi:cell division protein FtsI/penicillin-binding protein 2
MPSHRHSPYRLLLFLLLFTACSARSAQPNPGSTPSHAATRALPTVAAQVTHSPNVVQAAQRFLAVWQAEDYPALYGLIAARSREAIPQAEFTQRYLRFAISATLDHLEFKVVSSVTNPSSAQATAQVMLHTHLAGEIDSQVTLDFALEGGAWKVVWDEGLMLPELRGGNALHLDAQAPPGRGSILDRAGQPLATNSAIVSLGVVKGSTSPDQEDRLVTVLSQLTRRPGAWVRAAIDNENIAAGQYIPIGEALKEDAHAQMGALSALDGVTWQEYQGRFYVDEGLAPHVVGYVAAIQQGQEDQYQRSGYTLGERVGQSGIEYWGETYLTGQREADMRVVDAQGNPVTLLKHVDPQPAQTISLTIDSRLQLEAQRAIAGYSGAIVVLERDTGRVLAMVSSPGFDPNAFECGENQVNIRHCSALLEVVNDGRKRMFNRATGDGYPLGSVFKVITTAAALESGLFTAQDTLDCQNDYVIDGTVLDDWTKAKGYPPSGILTLPEGLMRSCDPWFYHIGELLYKQDHALDISNMARGFGLGSKTGIEGVKEEAGNVPEPTDPVEAARIAIGQNTLLVNPLQVARFMAAVGNDGTLYKPQVIEKIATADGQASVVFAPQAQGKLPVKPENLRTIQQALRRVVSDPRGTAVDVFAGLSIPVYGKTGTAQVDYDDPNAWFAGYTDTGSASRPDIAFAVIIENAGEGSEIAAPIARRLVEVYYTGKPLRLYPWEASIYATKTPAPTSTPAP